MKKIRKQSTTNKTIFHFIKNKNKIIAIPLLLLGIALIFSFNVGDVSAAPTGSDNISVPSDNLTTNSSNNQTGPDPDVIRGGMIVYSTSIGIQDAINHAQTGDMIRLENGATFYEHDLTIPSTITSLTFDVWNATHTGPGGYATIDAQHLGRIITINNGVTVNFNNITFTNGKTTDDGGAIYNQGTLNVINGTFTSNTASNRSGAICNIDSGTCTVTGCTFTGNSASGGGNAYGGAINNHGNYATLTVNNCTFADNTATGAPGSGGAIENWFGTSTITNSTFTGNIGTNGSGAIDNWYGTITVTSCTFTDNTGSTGNGGAIYNNGTLTDTNSTFTNNTASNGGAIYNDGTLTDTNSTFTNNTASNGGAIWNGSMLNLNNCMFQDNTATANGGAIDNTESGIIIDQNSTYTQNTAVNQGGALYNYQYGNTTDTESTFTNNTAQYGGAIYNGGTLNVADSSFTNNTAQNGGAIENYFGTLTVTGSTFTNNTATIYGGAIYNEGTLNVTGSTFTGNTANLAGAIYNASTLTVNSSTFTGNTATYYGGAIYDEYGTLTVTGSTFAGNTAYSVAGAICNDRSNLTVNSSTFTGNTASVAGAIYNYLGSAEVHLNRIVGNSNNEIYNYGSVNADNNWWGTNFDGTSPYDAGRTNFNVDNWLVLTVTASPDAIPSDSTSTVTADLNHDNHGNPVSVGHVPDGIPIIFNNPTWGTLTDITPATSTTLNGEVTATYHGNGAVPIPTTPVRVYAVADNEPNIYAEINILIPTTLTVNNRQGRNGDTVNITATLTRNDTNTGIANKPLTIMLNGQSYQGNTDGNGQVTWSYLINNMTAGLYPITATFTGDNQYEPSNGNGTLTVNPTADVIIYKEAYLASATANVGDTFNYIIYASNSGIDNATGLSVYDFISGVLTVNSITMSQGTFNPATRLWTVGTLTAGTSAWLKVNVTVKSSAAGHYIVNTAYKYTENEYDPTTQDDKCTVNIYVNKPIPTITIIQLETAALTVKNYYETHGSVLPTNVNIAGQTITMPQFLQLLVTGTTNISNGNLNPINVPNVNNPTSPSGTNTPGNLLKTEYLSVASNIKNFITTNGRTPNYATTSLGNIPFSKLVYMYSKIINFYQINHRLPNYVTI